jgi:hypothetical protein
MNEALDHGRTLLMPKILPDSYQICNQKEDSFITRLAYSMTSPEVNFKEPSNLATNFSLVVKIW